MAQYASNLAKSERLAPSKPVKDYPKESIKKITVLFTDIVGSSQFFKAHGDVAGTRMLKQHQDIVSPAIAEHGGAVVKFLGDSVMAYFTNPKEALKSGIKIQQRFKQYNGKKEPPEQIHIRLCIHFGNGIVEEKDIFGDVVNMAAKLLPMVGGDQIFISQELHNLVQEVPLVYFEKVKKPQQKEFFNGTSVYQVQWDEKIELKPMLKSMLFIKPLFTIGRNLPKVWDNILKAKNDLWGKRAEKEKILADQSIALIMDGPALCLETAQNLMELIKVSLGYDGVLVVPVQMIIDKGAFVMADRLTPENLEINWETVEPGMIYISAVAHKDMPQKNSLSVVPLPNGSQNRSFYKVLRPKDQHKGDQLFLYQNAMVQGEHAPCFYCGNKRHLSMNCPSKDLNAMMQGLEQLGYHSFNEINNIYFHFLTDTQENPNPTFHGHARKGQPTDWGVQAFYDLKAVYQLRFFRAIWNNTNEEWNKIKEKKDEGDKGGMVWIGQDCLRVGNHEQAESILVEALKKDPHDFYTHCLLGFLKVEQNNSFKAEHFFKKALNHCKSTPQTILTHFLLSRLYALKGDTSLAEERIRKILHLNRYCDEAIYQEIIFQFNKGRNSTSLNQLIKLIKKSREYFITALIDPELAPYGNIIHPCLRGLSNEAKAEALQIMNEAKDGLERLEKFLGKNSKEVAEAGSMWTKIETLVKNDSYFGYLDIIHYANSIFHMSHAGIEERRKRLIRAVNDLKQRAEAYREYLDAYPHPYLSQSVYGDLRNIRTRLEQQMDVNGLNIPFEFKEGMVLIDQLDGKAVQIQAKLVRLEGLRKMVFYLTRFFKSCLIFQSANLLIALVLFPIMTYYLSFVVPSFNASPQNIWSFQKNVLIIGTLAGLFLSLAFSTKKAPLSKLPVF